MVIDDKSQTVQIRQASPADLPRVMMINRLCLPENYTYFFFDSILQSYPKAFLVAEVGDEVVGYVMCRVEHGLSKLDKLNMKRLGHIISIAVLPEHRRMGIATALLTKALEILKEEYRCSEAFLEVRVSNDPAISLYRRLGFEVVKISRGYYVDGEDAYVMARRL
ncbi:MAG: ribosomal protein S18-alanine N-acetyltransferase [Nitrososphaerota archaeon]